MLLGQGRQARGQEVGAEALGRAAELQRELPSLERTFVLPYLGREGNWDDLLQPGSLTPERMPFVREIVEDLAALGLAPDVVVVTASGGGLAAGIALAVKARVPQASLFTAEPEGFDDHARSFKSGQREKNAALTGTICDALMAQTPGELTFAINRALIGHGAAVSDREVGAAVAFAFRELKLVVEPGGAVALAALLSRKIDVEGKVAVAVLSGGNVDPELFHRLVA